MTNTLLFLILGTLCVGLVADGHTVAAYTILITGLVVTVFDAIVTAFPGKK